MARRRTPVQRLQQRYGAQAGPQAWQAHDEELGDPFVARVVRPLINRLSSMGARVGSRRDQGQLVDLLAKAGYPGGLTPYQLQGVRMLLMLALPVVWLLLSFGVRSAFNLQRSVPASALLLFSTVLAMVGWISLPFILRRLVRKRQHEIGRQLPDVLDLITIAVEAGLGLDAAMDRVGNRYRGALGDELVRTNNEIRMGRPWNEAMRDLGERTGCEDLRTLVSALVQSRELGVNLSNVLHAQSLRLREERARRAREAAQKTPGKIIFPLVGCIFPTLFIVLIGPAALKAMKTIRETGMFEKQK